MAVFVGMLLRYRLWGRWCGARMWRYDRHHVQRAHSLKAVCECDQILFVSDVLHAAHQELAELHAIRDDPNTGSTVCFRNA
jgi:hypothetical protein